MEAHGHPTSAPVTPGHNLTPRTHEVMTSVMPARQVGPVEDLSRPGPARVRARTQNMARLSRRALDAGAQEYPEQPGVDYLRPQTFADCESVGLGELFACPFVSCKHHLAIDVNDRTGSIKLNRPDEDISEHASTCALRVADHGALSLEEVSRMMNLTRERVRQIEAKALRIMRADLARRGISAGDLAPDDLDGRTVNAKGHSVGAIPALPTDPVRALGGRR